MPAVPVLGERAREVRAAEVFAHGDAEHLRHAARDVDAAGEVGIELQRVHERRQQHVGAGVVGVRPGDGVDHAHGAVGDDELFEKAPEDQLCAEADVVKVIFVLVIELVRQLVVHADRALNDLREEGHEQRELADVALGGHFFAVDVEHVAHGLERVKRDAQRQQQPDVAERDRQPHGRKERLHGLGKEVIVFEHGEDAEVQQQDGDHERLAAGLAALFVRLALLALPVLLVRGDGLLHARGHGVHAACAEVGRERRHDDKAHVAQAHERVKRVAADQQHHPLEPLRHEVVQHQQREHQQVKRQRCQRHASSSGVRQVLSTSVANRSRTSVKSPPRQSATRGMSRERNTATPSVTE